jgi:hypothetical protein
MVDGSAVKLAMAGRGEVAVGVVGVLVTGGGGGGGGGFFLQLAADIDNVSAKMIAPVF